MEDVIIKINGDMQEDEKNVGVEDNKESFVSENPLIDDREMTVEEITQLNSENWIIVNENAMTLNESSAIGHLKNRLMSIKKKEKKEEVTIKDERKHDEISEMVSDKVFDGIEHFIGGCVQVMNEQTVEKYIELIKENYPVDKRSWEETKTKMREACTSGPKIRIKCHEGKIPGYYKKDKIQMAAFFKANEETEITAIPTNNNDDVFEFDFDKSFLLTGIANDILRIELRIVSAGSLVKRTLIGFVEKKVEDIPNVQDEEKIPLMKSDKGVLSLESVEELSGGYLKLLLTKDESEVHAKISVPRILKDHLSTKAIELFDLPEDSNRASKNPKSHFQVHITQKDTKGTMRASTPYQILHSQNTFTKCSDVDCTFPISCILTDHLKFGKEKLTSPAPTPSPRNSTVLESGSPMFNSLLSIANLNISNIGSPSSDNSFIRTAETSIGKKLGNSIGKALGNSMHNSKITLEENLFSPRNLNHFKAYISQLLPLGSENTHKLESKALAWITELNADRSLSLSLSFTEEDVFALYVKAIVKTSQKEGSQWNGKFNHSVYSVMKIIEECSNLNPMILESIKAKAFLQAHSISHLDNKILWLHILTLENDKSSSATAMLKLYETYALQYLANHRCQFKDEKLPDVLENLKILLKSDPDLLQKIKDAVHIQTIQLYHMWQEEVRREINAEAQTPTSSSSCGLFPNISRLREDLEREVTNNFELCSKMMNLHVLPDLQVGCIESGIQKAFEDLFDYQEFIARVYIEESKKIIAKESSVRHHPIANTPSVILGIGDEDDIKLSLIEGFEDNSLMNTDQASYNCFMALRRILKYFHISDQESWLFEHFKRYPKIWMGFAIKKAAKQIQNLIASLGDSPSFSRQTSENDSVILILQNLFGISNQVWKFWRKLNEEWPNLETQLRTGFILIDGLALLDKKIIEACHDIHMQDNDYEAEELASTIRILHGLKEKQKEAVNELESLAVNTQNNEKLNETVSELEAIQINVRNKENLKECYELIERTTTIIDKEIKAKMDLYCSFYAKCKIKNYLKNKNIHAVDASGGFADCLLYFVIEQEIRKLYEKIGMKQYCQGDQGINQKLWNTMEEEIIAHFEEKKERNKHKNKPSRFEHIRVAMCHIIDAKKGLAAGNIIASADVTKLQKIKDELAILAGDPVDLIKKCLKIKIKEQNDLTEDAKKSKPHIVLKIGLIKDSNIIKIDPVSLKGITPRPGKSYSKIQFYVHPFPQSDEEDHTTISPTYYDVEEAIAFDLDNVEQKKYEFLIEDEMFITITVFDINRAGWKHVVAEMVIEIKAEDIAQVGSESDIPSEASSVSSYLLPEFCQVYQSEEYLELMKRHDDHARHFVRKEEELRAYRKNKKPFLSFRH